MSTEILDPDDITEAQLAEHLEGRPIRYSPDEICSRCDSKNSLRMQYAGADWDDLPDETFEEQERIRFTVVYEESAFLPGLNWSVRGLFHERHPQQSQEEIAVRGTAQAVGTATLVRAADATTVRTVPDDPSDVRDDDLVLADVTIEFYSPPSEGEDSAPDFGGETVIAEGINDRPDWPEEENEWRKYLIREGEEPDD
ncbi:MAG: hypothetical protein ABEI98_03535 [Halorhabdus sp.]